MVNQIKYICPNCRGVLNIEYEKCNSCTKRISYKEDLISFAEGINYWSNISEEKLVKLINDAQNIGWFNAIINSEDEEIRSLLLWTDAPSRADPTFYLPITKSSLILDLGAGLGSYTFPLSNRANIVVAADSNLYTLKFIKIRAKQENIQNIIPIHITPVDDSILPFDSEQFDCVILNGVLEWIGSYKKSGDPKKIQKNALKEINRILKKDGTIFIGIENRFGFKYFLGAPDDHLLYYSKEKKISYTTLLPRFIANIITQKQLKTPYRTYTHSKIALEEMLKSAGFKKVEFYYPELDYRALSTTVIPLKSKEVEKSLVNRYGKYKLFKILSKLFGIGSFCDSYFVIGSKVGV